MMITERPEQKRTKFKLLSKIHHLGCTSDLDDILSQSKHLSMGENQAVDEMAKSLFVPTLPMSVCLVKTKEHALFKASTIWSYS